MPSKEAVIFLIISCQVRFRITPSPPKHIDNFTITLMVIVIVRMLVGEQIFGILCQDLVLTRLKKLRRCLCVIFQDRIFCVPSLTI
jgi:hypothetical protein